jgi:hypothetical protein
VSIIDYGLYEKQELPDVILSVAPQIPNWAATTVQREILSEIKRRIGQEPSGTDHDIRSICFFSGKAPRYLGCTFDEIRTSRLGEFPGAMEILVVPHVAAFVIVHAPVGAADGYPVPLGIDSFDPDAVYRVNVYVSEHTAGYAAKAG